MVEARKRQGVSTNMRRSVNLKHELARHLDALEPGGSGSAGLSRTDATGAETEIRLLPLLETAEHLSRALQQPAPPPHGKLQFGRAQLLAALAQQTRRLSVREQLTVEMRFAGKLVAALLALLLLLVPLSPRIVGAARDSMPGQLFYPLKLHMERVQFKGVEQPDVRISLGLAFLGERVAETQALAGTGRTLDHETVSEVYQLVNQVLLAVAQTPEGAMEDTLVYVAGQFEAYLGVLDALNAQATPANTASLNLITRGCHRGYLVAIHALEDPDGFRAAYRAGRPELFLLPGDNPLGGWQAPSNAFTHTHQEN
jgi:hypothetical protein